VSHARSNPKPALLVAALLAAFVAAFLAGAINSVAGGGTLVSFPVLVALGLPSIVAIIAAILVLLAGIPTGGYGLGSRWGGRRGV
jgi:hypothetical protein